jgi:hypothetical protein
MQPAAERHLEQARANHRLYARLLAEGTDLDWAVTLLFYTALQLVQAYFVETAQSGWDVPHTHEHRTQRVALKLPTVYAAYRFLQTRSEWARYEQDRPDPTADEVKTLDARRFGPIQSELGRLGIVL